MRIKNSGDGFGLATRLLHWIIALLIIGLIWLGWYMVDLTYYDRWYNSSLSWHKSLGMLVLALTLLKLGWQLYTPAPAPAGSLQPWERSAAVTMHRLLFAMMLLIPATGYLISTSDGKAVAVFGLFSFPALFDIDTVLRDLAIDLHLYLAYATAILLTAHAAAALKHQLIDRDGTLKRMLWGRD